MNAVKNTEKNDVFLCICACVVMCICMGVTLRLLGCVFLCTSVNNCIYEYVFEFKQTIDIKNSVFLGMSVCNYICIHEHVYEFKQVINIKKNNNSYMH